jgi:membrane protein YqaA with SNARE-associated domain
VSAVEAVLPVEATADSGATRFPPWVWPVVLGVTTVAAFALRFVDRPRALLYDFVWLTYLGNSLTPIPYDPVVVHVGKSHAVWLVVLVGTAATVVIEYWNMELLSRILSRDGTRGFRQHRFTRWTLTWYEKAPFISLVLTCALPIIPHYPMRLLATMARYPMWKYQLTVILGRGARYTWLALLGALFKIPTTWLVVASVLFLVLGWRGARRMNRDGAAEAEATA